MTDPTSRGRGREVPRPRGRPREFSPDQAVAATRPRPTPPLTKRELTVLRLLPGTITRQQLANELHILLATIKTHMHAIARELGLLP